MLLFLSITIMFHQNIQFIAYSTYFLFYFLMDPFCRLFHPDTSSANFAGGALAGRPFRTRRWACAICRFLRSLLLRSLFVLVFVAIAALMIKPCAASAPTAPKRPKVSLMMQAPPSPPPHLPPLPPSPPPPPDAHRSLLSFLFVSVTTSWSGKQTAAASFLQKNTKIS